MPEATLDVVDVTGLWLAPNFSNMAMVGGWSGSGDTYSLAAAIQNYLASQPQAAGQYTLPPVDVVAPAAKEEPEESFVFPPPVYAPTVAAEVVGILGRLAPWLLPFVPMPGPDQKADESQVPPRIPPNAPPFFDPIMPPNWHDLSQPDPGQFDELTNGKPAAGPIPYFGDRVGRNIPDGNAGGLPLPDSELPEITIRPPRVVPRPAPTTRPTGPSDFPFDFASPVFDPYSVPSPRTQPRVEPTPNAPRWLYQPKPDADIDAGFDLFDFPLQPGTWQPDFRTPDIGQPVRSTPAVPTLPRVVAPPDILTPISPSDPVFDVPLSPLPPRTPLPQLPEDPDLLQFDDPLADPQPLGPPNNADPCNCAATKPKKRKPSQPRTICYEGTFREYARGTAKFSKKRVPCDSPRATTRSTRSPRRKPSVGDLAKDIFGLP